jgi:cyclopropane fatty-acyl-phospholipid synthase-like methyltransferase
LKPYAESCDQNRAPILEVIRPLLQNRSALLEIGSGTGQHAVYFGAQLPQLIWHSSDLPENHPGILAWLNEAALPNVRPPLKLDVSQPDWPSIEVDAVFSANSSHIMHQADVVNMFAGVGQLLTTGGIFILYGPFNYANRYTSESNARFDQWLKSRDPASGIRNVEDLHQLAQNAGMLLLQDYAMPANNRILVWQQE